jgi:hypothetical protein
VLTAGFRCMPGSLSGNCVTGGTKPAPALNVTNLIYLVSLFYNPPLLTATPTGSRACLMIILTGVPPFG